LLVRATYIYGVVIRAHPVRGESHIERCANRKSSAALPATVYNCRLATSKFGKVLAISANFSEK